MTREGTGKTYASAFALRNIKYKRALFLVHREQIAKQAIASYKKVFGPTRTFGLLSGNHKADASVDYLFSTMQMMAKEEIRQQFPKDYFDVVVIDEAHRVGAGSYQRILDYFEPELLLGMTATPERTDNFDVFKAFDHNIAYEIRLKQALEEELLCPFHYFGISDIQVNNQLLDETKDFTRLSSSERINHIIEKIEYFGYSGDRVKGLIFCRSKEECQLLSAAFNQRGYRTNYLTGSDSQEKREKMISYLVDDQQIDYL
ncbi:DEAD/DEAH box helicase family protein, partial [Enterococcus cecorum]|nr:DEAD/DEAH box helicase family protein [Enterococcus cecorum]